MREFRECSEGDGRTAALERLRAYDDARTRLSRRERELRDARAAGSVDDATFSRLLEEVATERQTAIDVLRAQH